jgi:hypothetical protein
LDHRFDGRDLATHGQIVRAEWDSEERKSNPSLLARTLRAVEDEITAGPRVIGRRSSMHLRGIIQSATLEENPPGSELIEMVLRVQGVGAGQPRKLIIPYALLLEDASLEPESILGRGFEADVESDDAGRWLIARIAFASRVLRPSE